MILSLIVQLNVSSPALMDSETSLYPAHEEFLFSICKLIRLVFVLYLAQWEERVWLVLLQVTTIQTMFKCNNSLQFSSLHKIPQFIFSSQTKKT